MEVVFGLPGVKLRKEKSKQPTLNDEDQLSRNTIIFPTGWGMLKR
jgi:hypothetical protein